MADPYIGEIRIFPFNYAPMGWAFCNGQSMPVAQYQALFAVIGTIYGGDGQNNFNLPNLQGRAAMDMGTGPGLTPRNINDQVGAATVTLTGGQLNQHTHNLVAQNVDANSAAPTSNYLARSTANTPRGRAAANTYAAPGAMTPMAPTALTSFGKGQAHDNMQPYLPLSLCIALEGIFPVRQ
jgi:microcystin-dependent protein